MRKVFHLWPHRRQDTCRVHIKKYFDVDSQKYIRDKIEKLNTCSLADIAETDRFTSQAYWPYHYDEPEQIYNFPKFIPKDNDWVDEPIKKVIKPLVQEVPKKVIVNDQITITQPTDGVSVEWLKSMLRK